MTSSELKELVKSHFNLVEAEVTTPVMEKELKETFGRIADENGAFEIVFPGDSMQIGDKVSVETTDGQSMSAPDGEHRLADGTRIVTKDSVIEEIYGAGDEKALAEVEMATEEVVEAVEEIAEAIAEEKMEEEPSVSIEEVVTEIVDALKEEMGKMKSKMAELEEKVASVLDAPAAESTKMSSKPAPKAKFSTFNLDTAKNADKIKAAMAQLKNRKK